MEKVFRKYKIYTYHKMPIFKCHKCEYSTKIKCNFLKHLNKANPCKTEIVYGNEIVSQNEETTELYLKIEELLEDLETTQDEYEKLIKENEHLKHYKTKAMQYKNILMKLGYEIE
jgi:flagellar motility protein MotE (MotC chaperone)